MKTIHYFPTRYFPSISGAEFYIQRVAEVLKKTKKVNPLIYTSNAIDFRALRNPKGRAIKEDDKYFSEVNDLKIQRFNVDFQKSMSEKMKFIKSMKGYTSLGLNDHCLRKLIQNGPYMEEIPNRFEDYHRPSVNVIHTTFYPYLNLLYALILGARYHIPVVCTPFFHFSNPRYSDPDLLLVLKEFDKLIACTSVEKKILVSKLQIDSEKIEIIPMGVDFHRFHRIKNKKYKHYSFKKKFFREGEHHYQMVLFCGYKNYEKGAISILKAIPLIQEILKNVYYVFIGPPTQAFNRELSKIQENHQIRILNFTPDNLTGYFDKKKLVAFNEADVYVMPSRSDAFGIAFLEAWASSTPVIGANIGATPEVIKDKYDGLLVNFDEEKDIAENIVHLLTHKRIRKQMGKRGMRKVRENFTWDIIAQKTYDMYETLIKKERLF